MGAVTTPFDAQALTTIEASVTDAEKHTAAELVVVLARQSGHALLADLAWGALGALTTLVFVLFCPWEIATEMVVPDVAFGFLVATLLSANVPAMQRLLIPAERARQATSDGAKIAFVDHAVSATRDRTGILIYYSDRERDLVIMPDLAIQGRVAGHRFNEIRASFLTGTGPLAERIAAAVKAIGEAVRTEFPRKSDDADELPNAPRVQE